MNARIRLLLWRMGSIIVCILLAAGCANTKDVSTTQQELEVQLIVSAAASLKDAMEEIQQLYKEKAPWATVTYNFGSSGSLQQQIEQGAPADVFISAAVKQMDALVEKGFIGEDSRIELLENKVVLITPKEYSGIESFEDLAKDSVGKIALGEPGSVPAGQYAEEVFAFLGIQDSIQPKVVFAKDVREVLTWVETGNVDAGIVYETDAKVTERVRIIETAPEGSHKPIIYPAAVIQDTKNKEAATEFLRFLSSEEAAEVFEAYGFHALQFTRVE